MSSSDSESERLNEPESSGIPKNTKERFDIYVFNEYCEWLEEAIESHYILGTLQGYIEE